MKSKRKRTIKQTFNGGRYLLDHKTLSFTENINEATDYGIFAFFYKTLFQIKMKMPLRIVGTLSIEANFDSRLEMQMGGIKGFVNKILLKLLRFLDVQRSKITHKENE